MRATLLHETQLQQCAHCVQDTGTCPRFCMQQQVLQRRQAWFETGAKGLLPPSGDALDEGSSLYYWCIKIDDITSLFDLQGSEVSFHVGKAWSNEFLPSLVRSQLSRSNVENLSTAELTFVIFLCWRLRVLPVKSSDRQEHLKFSPPY